MISYIYLKNTRCQKFLARAKKKFKSNDCSPHLPPSLLFLLFVWNTRKTFGSNLWCSVWAGLDSEWALRGGKKGSTHTLLLKTWTRSWFRIFSTWSSSPPSSFWYLFAKMSSIYYSSAPPSLPAKAFEIDFCTTKLFPFLLFLPRLYQLSTQLTLNVFFLKSRLLLHRHPATR